MPRRVPSGVCFHPDGWAVRRRAVSHPLPQLWTKKACRAQGHSQNVCSQPPTCPLQLSGSPAPQDVPRQDRPHTTRLSLLHPHPATRPTSALKGHPPLAPGVPAQVGEQHRPPGLCFVHPSYPAVMVTSSTDLVHGGHRHTHRTPTPPHPTPPQFPGPSLPPCLVVKTLTLRGPDTQSRACRYLVSLPETWDLFF